MSTVNKFSVKDYLNEHISLVNSINENSIINALNLISETIENQKKIITCGNGGSATTASHYITDWNKMYNIHTGKLLRGICLADNIGLITAYANDISFDEIFSGQLKSILDDGDLLIAISGSGNSNNIINALKYANLNSANTLAILGYDGGKSKEIAHHNVLIPSYDMQICEDFHLVFGHMVMKHICEIGIIKD